MFCHKCGNQLPEDSGFCPKCGAKMMSADTAPHTLGTPLKTSEPREAGVAAKSTPPYTQNAQVDTPKKKKLGKLPIILGAAVLVIVLIIVVASMGNDSQQTSSSSNTGGVNLSETYTNEAEGISFKYPNAWEPIGAEEIKNYYTEAESENIVVFLANETKDASELNSYIEVLKFPSSQADIDHLWITDEEFKETFADDVSITKTSVIQLGGVPTRMIAFTTSEDIIYRSYFYGIDSNLYRVNFIRKGKVSATDERFFDAVIDSYTIAADDKSGKNGVGSPSTNEMLYKGQPIVPLIGSTPEELNKIFGAPTGGTPVTGDYLFGEVEYHEYGESTFLFDYEGMVESITVDADAAEMNGTALSQNRTGIIDLLGTPGYEGEEFHGEPVDYYFMEYTSYEEGMSISVNFPDANGKANNVTIVPYFGGSSDEEYQAPANDTATSNEPQNNGMVSFTDLLGTWQWQGKDVVDAALGIGGTKQLTLYSNGTCEGQLATSGSVNNEFVMAFDPDTWSFLEYEQILQASVMTTGWDWDSNGKPIEVPVYKTMNFKVSMSGKALHLENVDDSDSKDIEYIKVE